MAERVSTSRRQYLRELALDVARRAISTKYCGKTSSGANVWPFSRRTRRSMERARAKREFSELLNCFDGMDESKCLDCGREMWGSCCCGDEPAVYVAKSEAITK